MQTVNQVEDEMISKRHKVTDYKFHLCFKQYIFLFIFYLFKITEKEKGLEELCRHVVGSPPQSVKSLILIAASVVLEPHGSTGVAS